ncbi:hypothetical protein [Kitasatospora sp. NPDC008115]|uniref:hypothetical protein n=1 Tax=Kitasatospora sp. NPDC008115 TaxID=3364022 RepID=UPI0036EB9994
MTTTPALTPAARRGLFTTDTDQRQRPGTPEQPWELWLTGPDTLLPMPDLDDGSPLQPVSHALVLHHGYAWHRTGAAQPSAGATVPSLCWTAKCSICGDSPEDEFIPHHTTPEAAADDAVGRDWDELPDGRLVCDRDDDAHDTARAEARTESAPAPDEDQLTFL